MQVLTFDSEDEWLEARRRFITATMMARLMVSRSEWPRVWDEREHGAPRFTNDYLEYGHDREPVIAQDLNKPWDGIDSRLVHNDRPQSIFVADDGVSAATPDMYTDPNDDDMVIAEIKTVKVDRAWPKPGLRQSPRDVIPARYWWQVQMQLYVTGAERCIFAWETHEDFVPQKIQWCFIAPDKEAFKQIEATRDEFLSGKWRDEHNDHRAMLQSMIHRYSELGESINELKQRQADLKEQMSFLLEVGQSFKCDYGSVNVQAPQKKHRFDQVGFKKAHPDLFAEYYQITEPKNDTPVVTVRSAKKMTTTNTPTIFQALTSVMRDVSHVAKGERNQHQGFMFRGIDAVMNACGPALREHGVIAVPTVTDIDYSTVPTRNGRQSTVCRLNMAVTWYGPAGDSIVTTVWGEAFDAGDKATAKAHSVAFRTAFLETLCLPTDDPDPDHDVYEQVSPAAATSRDNELVAKANSFTDDGELEQFFRSLQASGSLTPTVQNAIAKRHNELAAKPSTPAEPSTPHPANSGKDSPADVVAEQRKKMAAAANSQSSGADNGQPEK
ncbi:ERF family protein [Corynebacterium amycolatum]|uniref:ERF family protein n=1 Tax=Corynebacterium amycolatum TaxID=43765 RepID=UPI00191DA3CA|nr:ERF family protein [Corynebacterium amycolatum]QQU97764.1 ERF family protein [Corynebacterium amycolatum]